MIFMLKDIKRKSLFKIVIDDPQNVFSPGKSARFLDKFKFQL